MDRQVFSIRQSHQLLQTAGCKVAKKLSILQRHRSSGFVMKLWNFLLTYIIICTGKIL